MPRITRLGGMMSLLCAAALAGCGQATGADAKPPAPSGDTAAATQPARNGDAGEAGERQNQRKVVLAGGCFWCVEAVFERIAGVQRVVSGFAGGQASTARYDAVAAGQTQHAESVEITYNPSVVTYGELLQIFFATHHPTQLNRQGPDVGTQYRSAIFYANDRQKRIAEQYIAQLNKAKVYHKPIATTLEKLDQFHPAESYHQDYVEKNPGDSYVQQYVPEKLKKLRQQFPDQLKANAAMRLEAIE